jgi:hypothetical protein
MLSQVSDEADVRSHGQVVDKIWNIYSWVDNATALYRELVQAGAKIDYGLCIKPYGCREFGVQDLHCYDIAFGQVTP